MSGSFSMYAYMIPYFLIDVAGITYAVIQWRRHPRLSLMVVVALGMALSRSIAFDLLWPVVSHVLGLSSGNYWDNVGLRTLASGVSVCSYGILVLAAFFGFQEAARGRRLPEPDGDGSRPSPHEEARRTA